LKKVGSNPSLVEWISFLNLRTLIKLDKYQIKE
jgi:hypothetical protein